nr:hypothetical protein [Tanacetum cinerariifolium]
MTVNKLEEIKLAKIEDHHHKPDTTMVRLWWPQPARPPPQQWRQAAEHSEAPLRPIRHPQPTTAAAAAGKAVAAAVVAAVAWEDGGTWSNGWRGWRSVVEIRLKNPADRKMERLREDFELVCVFCGKL